jgi:hypothetical protein
MTGVHQADFLGQLAVEQMGVAQRKGKPFFVHVTPVMVRAWGRGGGGGGGGGAELHT